MIRDDPFLGACTTSVVDTLKLGSLPERGFPPASIGNTRRVSKGTWSSMEAYFRKVDTLIFPRESEYSAVALDASASTCACSFARSPATICTVIAVSSKGANPSSEL